MFTKDEIEVCRTCDLPCAISAGCPLVHTWHTGTPTEEGLYLTTVKVDNCYAYEPVHWKNKWGFRHFDKPIVAWQKIEPYEASKDRENALEN